MGLEVYSLEASGEVKDSSSLGSGAAGLSGPLVGSGSATEIILPPLDVTVSVMVSPSANGLPRLRISCRMTL